MLKSTDAILFFVARSTSPTIYECICARTTLGLEKQAVEEARSVRTIARPITVMSNRYIVRSDK